MKRGKSSKQLGDCDLMYLSDEQRDILQKEAKRENPNERIFTIMKRFASISKRVEGMSSFYKGFVMDTDTISWVLELYKNTPPNAENYSNLALAVESYSKAQIWLGYFLSLVNSLNHDLRLRRLTAAEHVLRKLELEVDRGRRIFKNFNNAMKSLRDGLTSTEDNAALEYFE